MVRITCLCVFVAGCLTLGCQETAVSPVETQAEVDLQSIPDRHERPIVTDGGKTLLWAGEDEAGNVEWFDMTDGLVDPRRFQFGIGKDEIPPVDEPVFVAHDDPLLAERGVGHQTRVLGVSLNGVAKAYPVKVLDRHEVVNDDFEGEPYAVFW